MATGAAVEISIRERLLDAAADVFAEQGYDRARVQDIARRAGLSTGAIYGNFRDKADLLAEAIEIGMRAAVKDLERARQAGASAIQLLELMGKSLTVNAGNRQRRLLTEALAAARRDPQAGERVRQVVEGAEADLARVIERARRDGDVAPHIATAPLARFSMAVALGYHEIEGAGLPAPDGQEWSALMSHVIGSLRSAPAECPPSGRLRTPL